MHKPKSSLTTYCHYDIRLHLCILQGFTTQNPTKEFTVLQKYTVPQMWHPNFQWLKTTISTYMLLITHSVYII